MYQHKPEIWDALFELMIMDLKVAAENGVDVSEGLPLYPIILGNKGDWSYLASGTGINKALLIPRYVKLCATLKALPFS